MLFQERYQITRDTMEEIMHQYLHPSREDAVAREKMMQEINLHMSTRMEGTNEIVSYDDLDLSFLNPCPKEECKTEKASDQIFSNHINMEMNTIFSYDFSQLGNGSLDAA